MFTYALTLTQDDNGTLLVSCSDFPELTTFGDDEADAVAHARDALVAVVASRIDRGEDIPEGSPARGRPTVNLPPLVAAKVALYRTMREGKVRQVELAERLRRDPRQVRRMLDPTLGGRIEDIDRALAALGRRLEVSVHPMRKRPAIKASKGARLRATPRVLKRRAGRSAA